MESGNIADTIERVLKKFRNQKIVLLNFHYFLIVAKTKANRISLSELDGHFLHVDKKMTTAMHSIYRSHEIRRETAVLSLFAASLQSLLDIPQLYLLTSGKGFLASRIVGIFMKMSR